MWQDRPDYLDWLFDDVLASAVLTDALGAGWLSDLRNRVLAGDYEANRTALLAAAPVALTQGLQAASAAPSDVPSHSA